VVAVSHGVAEDLIGVYGLPRERIHVIYNPVNIHELQSKAEESTDHPWFAAGKPPVLLGVGRLTAAKDYVTLIRAFSLVRQQRNVRLVIAGEGEERSRLETLIKELDLVADVDLPGFIQNPISLMARARIFILSSNREGLPNALIQAMFVGTPLISTDCLSGPREILQGVQNSRLVPVGNATTLAKAIFSFLDNDITATTPPAAGRFASETVINSYLKLLMGED
jgi:glycosyltransferase involved in cell wall biosynthesis